MQKIIYKVIYIIKLYTRIKLYKIETKFKILIYNYIYLWLYIISNDIISYIIFV